MEGREEQVSIGLAGRRSFMAWETCFSYGRRTEGILQWAEELVVKKGVGYIYW